MPTHTRTLLLGLGNELVAGDDLGLRVVRRIVRAGLPPNVEAAEMQAGWFDVVERMLGCDRVVLVDAVAPGWGNSQVQAIKPEQFDSAAPSPGWSTHTHGLIAAMRAARELGLTLPEEVVVVGVASEQPLRWQDPADKPDPPAVIEAERTVRALLQTQPA